MLNDASIDLIKSFEGWRGKPYQDSVGVWTVGFGRTTAAGLGVVNANTPEESEAQSLVNLQHALERYEVAVETAITQPMTANEFGAMTSLTYNIGPGNFAKSSVVRLFNAGDKAGAANAFLKWNKAGGKVLPGLTRRREAERKLFLTEDEK